MGAKKEEGQVAVVEINPELYKQSGVRRISGAICPDLHGSENTTGFSFAIYILLLPLHLVCLLFLLPSSPLFCVKKDLKGLW